MNVELNDEEVELTRTVLTATLQGYKGTIIPLLKLKIINGESFEDDLKTVEKQINLMDGLLNKLGNA